MKELNNRVQGSTKYSDGLLEVLQMKVKAMVI